MKYDASKIGNRIRENRKQYPGKPNQEDFGRLLLNIPMDGDGGVNRKVIASWEKGERIPPLDMMLKMCDLFDCDLGYLLCEYDTKTRTAAEIQDETGLSEAAINILRSATHGHEEMPKIKTLLIDQFILDCTPAISGALYDLFADSFRQSASELLAPNITEKTISIFNKIFFGDYPEHLKPMMFIDEAIDQIEHGWHGEGAFDSPEELLAFQTMQKDRYYDDYIRLADNMRFDKTAMYRYQIDLVFNQMIDKLLGSFREKQIIMTDDLAKRYEEERQESNYGEYEKK